MIITALNIPSEAQITIVVYVIAAAVIYFISYKIYKHRDLENAGSFIAIPKLKPVFRWGPWQFGRIDFIYCCSVRFCLDLESALVFLQL